MNERVRNPVFITVLWLVTSTWVGCSKVPPHQEGLVSVGGVVTIGGLPVAGAVVVFHADKDGRSASAITDGEGHYQMTTFQRHDGVMPGSYAVSIVKYEDAESGASDGKYVPIEGNVPVPKSVLPVKYASPKTSGLTASVQPGTGNQSIEFALAN